MARLRRVVCSEDDDSDYGGGQIAQNSILDNSSSRPSRSSPRKNAIRRRSDEREESDNGRSATSLKLIPKVPLGTAKRNKQIRLAPLKCLKSGNTISDSASPGRPILQPVTLMDEPSPRRTDRPYVNKVSIIPGPMTVQVYESAEDPEAEIEESVWCGSDPPDFNSSDDDDDLPSPRKFLPPRKIGSADADACSELTKGLDALQILDQPKTMAPPAMTMPSSDTTIHSRPSSSSDKENKNVVLRFSPPRLYSPKKQRPAQKGTTITPPPSPSKGKLQSPSKQKFRIPTPPHRPSIGAFWDPETVNGWNDQHSPRKEWKSPKKLNLLDENIPTSPTSSPRKSSPSKRTRAEIEARRDWEIRKHELAESFLTELDQSIASGQIAALSACTGGIKIIWSKTLKQTAGRANWKNEKTRTQQADGSVTVTNKHHASIELAEKVIDDEERLLNVVAHEFCHLCNFMISGIKDQPHGKQFKEWGRKASLAFADRGIEVTTKHTYAIEYKYIWRCSGEFCGAEFKRHSKSIDTLKQRCGSCKGGLVQIKPVPRKETAGSAKINGYAVFVKAHFALVKKEMPGASQKGVMEAVARKYRAEKAMMADEKQKTFVDTLDTLEETSVDHVARKLEFAVLDDN